MKFYLIITILILQNVDIVAGNTIVTITCSDFENSIAKLQINDALYFDDKGFCKDSSIIDNRGCKLTASLSSPAFFNLQIDDNIFVETIYLEPGDSLNIDVSGDSLNFSGYRALENNFFIELFTYTNRDDNYYNKILSCNQEELIKLKREEIHKLIEFSDIYFSGKQINPFFISYVEGMIKYFTARDIIHYLDKLKFKKLITINYNDLIIELMKIDFPSHDKSLLIPTYKYYLYDLVNLLVKKDLADSISLDANWNSPKDMFKLMFEKAFEKFDNDIACYTAGFIVYRMVQEKSDSATLKKASYMINTLTAKNCEKYLASLVELLKLKESFLTKDAPDFELLDSKGNIIKLSSFKGQYVLWTSGELGALLV